MIPSWESSASSNATTLQWAANTESDLAGYRVYHGLSRGVYEEVQEAESTTTYQFQNLKTNTTHYFTVTAYDIFGNESAPSEEVSKTIGTATFSNLKVAVLPSSRSVQVGTTATTFGLLINGGTSTATSCSLSPGTSIPATFSYQTTDPQTNALTGSPNTPVDLAAGQSQTFIFSLTPTTDIPPTEVQMSFDCTNTDPASSTVGLNTLLLSASTTPVPDIVALVAVPTNDGITHLPGPAGAIGSSSVFVVASLNVGATGPIKVSADTGNVNLPLTIALCQTNTATGVCLAPPRSNLTTNIPANTTHSFGVFVEEKGPVPFDPTTHRIFIRFKDQNGITRGSTSVAIQTQ